MRTEERQTIVAYPLYPHPILAQRLDDLALDLTRYRHAVKGAVNDFHAVERAAAAFGEEFGGVGCRGGGQVGEGGERVVGFFSGLAGDVGSVS